MILFASDWALFPTAIVHTSTSNKSWVHLASVYRHMGIRNHAFLLALVDPSLEFVDPHDPNLTIEQMAKVAIECRVNPWYFFREVARAPASGGSKDGPMEANRGNITLFWCFFNHVMIILIQIRQTGKSFSTDMLMAILMNVLCQNTNINLLTKDDVLRRKNVTRLKDIMASLPPYLYQKTRDDVNNTEEITIRALGNTYTTHVPQSSPKAADKMGRGLTSAIFHIDEPPFQPNISIALPAALAATGAAVDAAKKEGSPYGTILTTTAGRKDDKDGKYVYNLLLNSALWSEKFLDAPNLAALEKMIRNASRGGHLRINATFNHRQLGKSDEWLKEKLQAALAEGDAANRDFFNMWTSGGQDNPLSISTLEIIDKSLRDVAYTEICQIESYIVRWYIQEDMVEKHMTFNHCVLGMDTAEAGGGDDISLVIIDIATLDVIAAGTYNETNMIKFSSFVCWMLCRFPKLTACIERRSTGAMLIDYLLLQLPLQGVDPFVKLFNTVVDKGDEDPEAWREIRVPMNRRDPQVYTRYKKSFGFTTSGSGMFSRSMLYSVVLQNAAKRAGSKMHDKILIEQVKGLVTKNGRIDHMDGGNDDMVIGWLLTHWFLTTGRNLSHYGINPREIMSRVTAQRSMSVREYDIYLEQQEIRGIIKMLTERLESESDEFMIMRIEQELKAVSQRLINEESEVVSVDEMIRVAREKRKARHKRVNPYSHVEQNYSKPGQTWYAPDGRAIKYL